MVMCIRIGLGRHRRMVGRHRRLVFGQLIDVIQRLVQSRRGNGHEQLFHGAEDGPIRQRRRREGLIKQSVKQKKFKLISNSFQRVQNYQEFRSTYQFEHFE